jgi:hypothetical protein
MTRPHMRLSHEEREMLAGAHGDAARWAIA